MSRAALLCPGRGSYTERSLGSLEADHPLVAQAEALRLARDLPSLLDLDRAERFRPSAHLLPSNVSPLVFLCSVLDAEAARAEHELVAVGGNSLGWYTALVVAGALSFADGFRLVQEMSLFQERHGADGGQVLFPLVDEDWRPDPELAARVTGALEGAQGQAAPSIELGGYTVLAGTEAGVRHLLGVLPEVAVRGTRYPFRLVKHGPYHTRWAEPVARLARQALSDLAFRAPAVTLVDGRGARHTPWSCDVPALARYTLGEQVTTPFSFTRTVRVVLREHAPARLVLPGPGNTLGGVCGQIIAAERWRGVDSRAAFEAVQASAEPLVVSMRR